ncbi:MAG: hypothetical protein HY252_17880 [Sphingobacteriales bacterium]|nr:hypothetical protein [Sphingobacteriales bacterium]
MYLNIDPMFLESSLISQFQNENETWKRILAFIKEENINIKNRLSEIVKNMDSEEDMLERIEYFQNCFVEEDEKLRYMVKEVDVQGKSLIRDIYEDGNFVKGVKSNQSRLRKEMEKTEKDFNKLKFEFNSYLSEAL